MLDQLIVKHSVRDDEIRRVGKLLTDFYQTASPIAMSAEEYCQRLIHEVRANQVELTKSEYGLRIKLINSIAESQLHFLRQETDAIAARANSNKIIDAHGDLRPEHICLLQEPVIIDCLEFNRGFRILDAASELAFLALECERLGAAWVGARVLQIYEETTGDRPPERLVRFYQSLHACLRAKIAVWHLKDHDVADRAKWIGRATTYLALAALP